MEEKEYYTEEELKNDLEDINKDLYLLQRYNDLIRRAKNNK